MLQKIKGKAVKHLSVGFLLLSVEGSRENEGSYSHTDTEMLVGNLELAVFTIETDLRRIIRLQMNPLIYVSAMIATYQRIYRLQYRAAGGKTRCKH